MAEGVVDRDCHQPCAPVRNSAFFLCKRKHDVVKIKILHASLEKKTNTTNLSFNLNWQYLKRNLPYFSPFTDM